MHANGKSRLIAAAGAAYLGMGYLAAISDHPPLITILLGIVPLGAVALVTAWHSRARILSLFFCVLCANAQSAGNLSWIMSIWLMELLASRHSSTANFDVAHPDELQQWLGRLHRSIFGTFFKEKQLKNFDRFYKPAMWSTTLLLAAIVLGVVVAAEEEVEL